MTHDPLDEAIAQAEKANANLEPELIASKDAQARMAKYARLRKLAEFGETALASKVDDPVEVAPMGGTSVGKARATVETAKALKESGEVKAAFAGGDISLDQATEIARADAAKPGSATELLKTAETESFQVLRDKARSVVLEAEQKRGLAERQREARSSRSHTDPLGMMNINLRLEPHVGVPLVNRAEAEASRLYKAAKRDGKQEPFERHLADAYAAIFSGSPVKAHSTKPELVVVVSHEVAKRGWTDIRDGEMCKIPGVGPVAPDVAREIAPDAFITGVVSDGKDLRQIKRWTRSIPVEVRLALELGDPPEFDGVKCVDCGKRFRPENDHVDPFSHGGATSKVNLRPRCNECHAAKTARDRTAGKLTPQAPDQVPDKRSARVKKLRKRGPPRA